MDKQKIFIGTEDVAFYLSELAEGFRNIGYEVTTYVTIKNKFSKNKKYDYIGVGKFIDKIYNSNHPLLPKFLKELILISVKAFLSIFNSSFYNNIISSHDIFIFIWEPWIHEKKLFRKLKEEGKHIVCIHLGSEVRHYDTFCKEFKIDPNLFPKKIMGNLNKKTSKIRLHEYYADSIYSVPDQAGLMISPYHHVFLPLSKSKKIEFKLPDNEIPTIIHVPSNPKIKGTDIFLKTINKLKCEGIQFNFEFCIGITNDELLAKLSNADILLDELKLNGPGMLGLEAMASGCVVVTKCLNHENFKPPIISVNEENLYINLKNIILNKSRRIEIALEAKKYIIENNSSEQICKEILSNLEKKSMNKMYYPSYFLNTFEINDEYFSKSNKKLNRIVLEKFNYLDEKNIEKYKKRGIIY